MDYIIYSGLFATAFLSATLLPLSSEAVLSGLLLGGGSPLGLWAVATCGNSLGALVNWGVGRVAAQRGSAMAAETGRLRLVRGWFNRYGVWTLLLAWLPIVGDLLTVLAGWSRVGWLRFLVLVTIGKGGRYWVIVGYLGQ